MENLFKVILLAIIQGVTEFLPVSSSGHLVLSEHFLGLDTPNGTTLVIVLHSGTLVSILTFYWCHISQLAVGVVQGNKSAIRFVLLVVLGCIPAIILGFSAKNQLEGIYSNPKFVSCMLIVTGLFLIASHFSKPAKKQIGWVSGLIIGLSQAAAMLPGISRSGSTICTARFLGIEPKEAAEYSFLMSAPLMAGVSLLSLLDILYNGNSSGNSALELGLGFVISAVVGYFSLKWLVSLLQRGRFWLFGIYCLIAGVTTLFLLTI